MKDRDLFQKITGKTIKSNKNIKHKIISDVDDMQHIISRNNYQEIKEYMQDLHLLLIKYYEHNNLKINAQKTEYLFFDKSD